MRPEVGRAVWFRAPKNMDDFISSFPDKAKWYADPKHGFIKDVIAAVGDEVCNRDGVLTVNNRVYAYGRLDLVSHSDRLPWWRGCMRLDDNQIVVGSKCVDDSIDSRYFGPIRVDETKVLIPLVSLGKCDAH